MTKKELEHKVATLEQRLVDAQADSIRDAKASVFISQAVTRLGKMMDDIRDEKEDLGCKLNALDDVCFALGDVEHLFEGE